MMRWFCYQMLKFLLDPCADELEISSLHMTFNTEEEWALMGQLGFQQRSGDPVPLGEPGLRLL